MGNIKGLQSSGTTGPVDIDRIQETAKKLNRALKAWRAAHPGEPLDSGALKRLIDGLTKRLSPARGGGRNRAV